MLSDRELEQAISVMLERLGKVNRLFIRKVAAQIKTIGELNTSSIHTLLAMGSFSNENDIAEINRALATATDMNVQDLMKLYQKALNEAVAEPAFQRFLDAQQAEPEPTEQQKSPLDRLSPQAGARIQQISNAISAQTSARMINLSNTTAVREQYRQYVDRAVTAVTAGYQSYDQARREIIRDLGENGLKVVYESGYRRRLDTAVRQNIIDGAKQINQQASLAMGKELGFDAVEISAHLMSAPDHEPVQGRVFLKREYEKMQNGEDFRDVDGKFYPGFRRPIAEWNCMHFATAFSTEYSIRRYDDKTLKEWARRNADGCEIDGKHLTTYEASQYMRELETRAKRQKDIVVAAKDAGDDELRRECQENIDAIAKRYYQVADAAGLRPDPQRMSVEGFRRVKIPKSETPELKNAAGQSIIKVKHTATTAAANSITQRDSGRGADRNFYGADGRQTLQISNNGHGHKSEEALGKHGEHAHDYQWDENGKMTRSRARELTEQERRDNNDFL